MVESYGDKVPINQVGNINVPESQLLTVQVWDDALAPAVEKAIRDSDLGLNPSVAAGLGSKNLIRIPIPSLNEERRTELAKLAGKYAEEGKVSIRNVRRDGMDKIKKLEKAGDISEDEGVRLKDDVQDMTDKSIKKVEDALASKEKDIMKV
jgi:ribosome recycling factor